MDSDAAPPGTGAPPGGGAPVARPALLAELATLGTLARATGRARTSGEIAAAAVEILCRSTDAPAALLLFNDGEGYAVGAHRGLRPELVALIASFGRVGARLTEALEASEQPLYGPLRGAPLRSEIVDALEGAGIRFALLVGLRAAGELIGVMGLGWRSEPGNRPLDAVIVQAATLIGVGLDNARLVERLERALASERRLAEEQAALQSLTLIAERAQAFRDLADTTIRQVVAVVGASAAAYGVVDGGGVRYEAALGVPPDVIATVSGTRGAAMIAAIADRGPYLDTYRPGAVSAWTLKVARREGWQAYAIIPIRDRDRLAAVLVLYFDRPIEELSVHPRSLERIGAIVSISLANFRLRERMELSLTAERTLTEEQATLTALTMVADAEGGLRELATTTLNQVVRLLGGSAGAYALIRDNDLLDHVAHVGVPDQWIGNVRGVRAGTMTPVRRLASGEDPYLQRYVEGEVSPTSLAHARELGFTAYAALPIRVGADLAGLMTVWFTRPFETIQWNRRAVIAMSRIAGFSLTNERLRERLTASESLYRTLFEASPDAVILLSADHDVVAANRAALDLYRTDLDGLRTFVRAQGGLLGPEGRRRRQRTSDATERETFRNTARRPDGSTFPLQVDVADVNVAGERRVLMIVRDLTEQDRSQRELLQAQKMEAIGQLVSGVAHELNNPLASIIAFSQLLRGDPRLPDDMRADAELLTQEADRTRRIVQNLLDFARQRPPERVPTSVRALVDSVLALQSYTLSSARVTVDVDIPDDVPTINVDRSQLQQVLLNLIHNASQAIRSSAPGGRPGTIRISARVEAADGVPLVRIAVTDTGPGVPTEDRPMLFVPFFTTKEPGEGTGLGLPVSFGIVASHGGRLWFEPGPDGLGATFAFTLPVRTDDEEEVSMADPQSTAQPRTEGRGSGALEGTDDRRPGVLVLDDEPSIRAFLTKALRLGRFDPVVAQRGPEALDWVRERSFDVVLVDHRMPGMSGTEVYDAAVAIRPELAGRFVFMSGDVLNPDLRVFAEERGIALLAKPFDVESVLRLVGAVARQEGARG